MSLQEMTVFQRLKVSHLCSTDREPHIGKYEVFIAEIKVLLKLPLVLLLNLTCLNTFKKHFPCFLRPLILDVNMIPYVVFN